MVRTRSTPMSVDLREGPGSPNDRAKDDVDAPVNKVKDAFKTSLQKFRHDATDGTAGTVDSAPKPSYKNGRKRPLADNDEDLAKPSPSPSPAKRAKKASGYAPPSTYAHLPKLLDVLEPDLICVFIGVNPGIRTATSGHAYAHPSNMFWKLLHSSGCTDERLRPEQDVDLPKLYSMGNTNIVERPTRDASQLSKTEMAEGTPVLEAKIREFRPEAVCIVGKGIWEAVWRYRYGRGIRKEEFKYGWQDEKERMGTDDRWKGAHVFVATSTSGLSAGLRPHEKEAIWRPFGEWVRSRRDRRTGKMMEEVEAKIEDDDDVKTEEDVTDAKLITGGD